VIFLPIGSWWENHWVDLALVTVRAVLEINPHGRLADVPRDRGGSVGAAAPDDPAVDPANQTVFR
jgi:hypothetical protein